MFDISHFGHIAVLYGGTSSERAVSLISGRTVYQALKTAGFHCTLIDTQHDVVQQLESIRPDRAFIALHGKEGEDGVMQGLLQMMNIPYTGSDVASSALAMDKYRTKLVWKGLGLPTPAFQLITAPVSPKCLPEEYPFPCFVKATRQGSTRGTYPVKDKKELLSVLTKAEALDKEILIEQWIEGKEFSVSILNNQALPAIRIEAASGFYDYEAKYELETTNYFIPCGLSAQEEQQLQDLAVNAFNALGCSGWGRVDCMQDKTGKFWLIEVNTVPGMTSHSLVPQAADAADLDFTELVVTILATTFNDSERISISHNHCHAAITSCQQHHIQ
ncbi:MAG: D-alanine--D-alanine ligase [Endozoicomonadaceae bacterium]|nr:D-alanine--D-alanine ligase [Endozoicomonadaceae bacterium]